jgi:capsular exopolysaccharide synthesis family protein
VALSSNSFTSFSPGSPPPESEKQPATELVPLNPQDSILPPTDAPTGVSETIPAPPPTQSVTVVVSPSSEPKQTSTWLKWTTFGAFLGLAAGLAAAGYQHTKLPGEFESAAKLQVSGPAGAADADTQIAILRSKSVLSAAASKLDEQRPYAMPPDQDHAKRVAFLEKGLAVAPEIGSGSGTTLNVTFRGPHAADTPKYLKSVVDAYKSDLSNRPAGAAVVPKSAPGAVAGPNASEVERVKLQGELAALTSDEASVIEKRIADAKAKQNADQSRLKAIDGDLARIAGAGSARRDRLAVMEQLGVKSERPEIPAAVLADAKAAEESLKSLQTKKAELGQRLGPDHRDMVALNDQIASVKERIAKAAPVEVPGPDELDKHRAKLEQEKAGIAGRAPGSDLAADQKLLTQVNAIRKKIEALPVAQVPAPIPAVAAPSAPVAFSVQAVVPPSEGTRIGPPWSRSLVPGGAIGLFSGAVLGLLISLTLAGSRKPVRRTVKPVKPLVSPIARTSSPSVPITSGPKLAVPIFANVPQIADDGIEKKSAMGWSPKLVLFSKPNSVEAEVFRIARRELVNALHNRGHQVVPVTSPGSGDGKSLVAANLALSLAQSGKRVLLVDCDFENAKVQELFRLTRLGDSLKSVMNSIVDLRMAVRSTDVPNLFLLPAGRGVSDAHELLSRPKFNEVIAELRAVYEYVIIDAPSAEHEVELGVLAGCSDGAVLVVRNASDAPVRAERAKNAVIAAGSRVLGAIVNAAPVPAPQMDRPKALAAV